MGRVVAAVAVLAAICALTATLGAAPAGEQDGEMLYQDALNKEQGSGDLDGAIAAYRTVVERFESSKPLAAKAALRVAGIYERQDKREDAAAAYRKVIGEFASSGEAAEAQERLKAMGETDVSVVGGELEAELARRVAVVDLKDADIDMVVEYLRGAAGVNIVVDSRVRPMLYRPAPVQAAGQPSAAAPGASAGGSVGVTGGVGNGSLVNMVPVTIELRLRDVAVSDIVNLATRSLGLDWAPWSGAIFISDQGTIAQIKFQEVRSGPRPRRTEDLRGLTPDALIERLYIGQLSPDEMGRIARIEQEAGKMTEQDLGRLLRHAEERERQIEEERAAREAGIRAHLGMAHPLPEPLPDAVQVEASDAGAPAPEAAMPESH